MTREDINDIINAICPNDEDYEKPCISPKYLRQELEQLALDQRQWNEEPTTKNDLALIHTEGLDEEIRCTMCTNYMKSDRGCDGSCVVNDAMYKKVMDAIEKRIQPTTKNNIHDNNVGKIETTTENDLGADCISRIETIDYLCKHCPDDGECFEDCDEIKHLRQMSSVTPQLSSGLEKNSQKLKKDFGELDCISRADAIGSIAVECSAEKLDIDYAKFLMLRRAIKALPTVTPIRTKEKCKWIKYDHRTMCPKEHIDVDSPYWRIPENRMETLKYCPYCGKEIEVET